MSHIAFALLLAISTQFLNFVFIKLNYFNEYDFYLRILFVTLSLSPIVIGLNYLFAIYYRIYTNTIDYVVLYMSFIIFSVIVSFFIQYLVHNSTNMSTYRALGITMSLVGVYLIVRK